MSKPSMKGFTRYAKDHDIQLLRLAYDSHEESEQARYSALVSPETTPAQMTMFAAKMEEFMRHKGFNIAPPTRTKNHDVVGSAYMARGARHVHYSGLCYLRISVSFKK